MKTNKKIYILSLLFLLTNIFLFKVDKTRADDCSDCVSEYGEGFCMENGFCYNSTNDPYVNDSYAPVDSYQNNPSYCYDNYDTESCCQTNGGYWYNGTCNTDPPQESGGDIWSSECIKSGGQCAQNVGTTCETMGSDFGRGENMITSNLSCNGAGVCCMPTGGTNGSGSGCNKGYYKGRDNQCYPSENLDITQKTCPNGEYLGRDNQCYSTQNLSDAQKDCSTTDDCLQKYGSGYKCDSSGTCMVDGFFSGTECKSNSDCDRLYGSGFECSGVFVSTCERKPTSTVNTGSTQNGGSTPTQTVRTTQPVSLANGTVAPTGTTVNPVDGSAVSPTGQKYPPGSFQVPSGGVSNGIVMCANGVLATECRDGNGNMIGGAPLTVISNPGSRSGNVAGVVTTPKCGTNTNFTDIGGVCFPTNTGLSSAPIYVILSNIFSWLMGLFTTLAVVAFVISGIQYLMASGDESLAKSAKNNATNAVIGIIVGLSGFIIIKAIAAALAGQGYFF